MSQYAHKCTPSSAPARVPAAIDEQRCPDAPYACRTGVARITANDGGGAYTVTEQRRDADEETWTDASAPLGHVEAEAIDLAGRTRGIVGQIVPFAEHRGAGGEILLLIDVGSEGWMVKISANDAATGLLVDKLVGDDGTGDNLKVSFQEVDDGGTETLKAVIAKADLPACTCTDQLVAVVSGDSGDYLGNQVKTFAGDSTDIGVTLEVDGSGEAAKLQAKVSKSDIASVASAQTGHETIITHSIKIPAGTSAGSAKVSDDVLLSKLILHSAYGTEATSPYCDWQGGDDLKTLQPVCHNVGASLSSDDVLQWDLTPTGSLGLKIASADGKLYWTWNQDNTHDQHGFCEVKVRSGTVDHTAS